MPALNYNDFIVRILVSPSLRVLRYMILLVLVLCIATGFVFDLLDRGVLTSDFERNTYFLVFAGVIGGGCCLNIYVLTPCLLLKNKWWKFFISLTVLVLVMVTIVTLMQSTGAENGNVPGNIVNKVRTKGYFTSFINILSAFLAFFLLFAGTSSFVLFKKWILDMEQSKELESTTLHLELKLLENQINPHFLFNMLNNANIMVRKDPEMAIHIIGKLEEMLRYLMNENKGRKVSLKDEVVFLTDFLELEKTRRDYFNYTITVTGEKADNVRIVPLLFIIFVENAVKHNHDSRKDSYVHLSFRMNGQKLFFVCENSIPEKNPDLQTGGIGLANVTRRLDLLCKGRYSLEQMKTERNYTVKLELSF